MGSSIQDGRGRSNDKERVDNIPEALDVIQQPVAIKSLMSILYYDFDHLKMESECGKIS